MDLHHLHRWWQGTAAAAEAWQDRYMGRAGFVEDAGHHCRYLYVLWLTWRAHTRLLVE
jgi:hypothetical protein